MGLSITWDAKRVINFSHPLMGKWKEVPNARELGLSITAEAKLQTQRNWGSVSQGMQKGLLTGPNARELGLTITWVARKVINF